MAPARVQIPQNPSHMPALRSKPWIQHPKASPCGLGLCVTPQKRDKKQLPLFTNICCVSPCRSLSAQSQSAHHSPLASREALAAFSSGLKQSRRFISKCILLPSETLHGFYLHRQSNVIYLLYKPADLHIQPPQSQGSFRAEHVPLLHVHLVPLLAPCPLGPLQPGRRLVLPDSVVRSQAKQVAGRGSCTKLFMVLICKADGRCFFVAGPTPSCSTWHCWLLCTWAAVSVGKKWGWKNHALNTPVMNHHHR